MFRCEMIISRHYNINNIYAKKPSGGDLAKRTSEVASNKFELSRPLTLEDYVVYRQKASPEQVNELHENFSGENSPEDTRKVLINVRAVVNGT